MNYERLDEMMDEVDSQVEEAVRSHRNRESTVVFSNCRTDDESGEYRNTLLEVPVRGKSCISQRADSFWGGSGAEDYISPVLDSPTWLELCVHADDMILKTQDYTHYFLEGITQVNYDPDLGIPIFEFDMGS